VRILGSVLSILYLPRGRLIWPPIPSKGKSCSSARCWRGPAEPIRLAVRLGFRPLEHPHTGVPDTMVLEVPGAT
jgi:hypothetical protein